MGGIVAAIGASMSNVSNNEFIQNRWRINRDGICAKKELQSSSIDEDMLVGNGHLDRQELKREQK